MLLHERVHLLVRDEEQQAVDGLVRRVQVAARAELLDPVAYVAEKVVAVPGAFDIVVGLEVAHVVVERELHVHVHDQAVREEEGVVGPARARERRLLAVVDALEEPGELQNVLRHPLAPLPTRARVGERLPQLLCVFGERVQAGVLALQLVGELTERLVPIVFQLAYEVADLAELAGHRDELLVDEALLAVQLRRGAQPFLFHQRAVRVQQASQQLARVGGLRHLDRTARHASPAPRPRRRADLRDTLRIPLRGPCRRQ